MPRSQWDSPEPSPEDGGRSFGGTFTTDDAVLAGSLEFAGEQLVMWAGDTPLLTWHPGECVLERLTSNRFVLTASGETITFTADDPDRLEAAPAYPLYGPRQEATAEPAPTAEPQATVTTLRHVSPFDRSATDPAPVTPAAPAGQDPAPRTLGGGGRRPYIKAVGPLAEEQQVPPADSSYPSPPASALESPIEKEDDHEATMADIAVTRARGFRSVRARRWWTREVQAAAVKVAVISGVVLVVVGFAYGVMLLTGGFDPAAPSEQASGPTTSIVTVPTTTVVTVAPPATVPLTTSVFELTGPDFAERWNVLASDLDESLLLSPNLTNPFSVVLSPYITLDGVLDPVSGNVRLRSAPTGSPEGDRAILVALALVIGTTEPSLTPTNRGQLLEALGLDPRDPQLGGIDGARTYNGRLFRLVYLPDQRILEFTVSPENAVSTTTAG